MLTWPAAGGGMRDCGKAGIAAPQSLQKRAKGSDGRGAKQLVHLQSLIANLHNFTAITCSLCSNCFYYITTCMLLGLVQFNLQMTFG